MEQVSIGGGDGQTPSDHNGTANLLNALNLPTPPWRSMVKVLGNGVPGAVGQGRRALLPGLQVPWMNGAGEIRQGFGSGTEGELDGSCLSVAGSGLEHWVEPLWVSKHSPYSKVLRV
jgi:hypothetical protein